MPLPQDHLFTMTISAHKSPASPSPGGKITVTRLLNTTQSTESLSSHPATGKPRPTQQDLPPPSIYLLTFHSPPDNRLTPPFCSTFLHALLRIQQLPPGLLLTTSTIPKFFSNGLDLSTFTPETKIRYLYPLWRKLLTFPMPTCAVINGHAFAGGFMTAMFHDYRIMNPHRGWLCLNELEFDAELAPAMLAVFRVKVADAVVRGLVLEARRVTGLQALEGGLVDGLGGVEEAVKVMTEVEGNGRGVLVVAARGRGGVFGRLKEEMYRDVLGELDMSEDEEREAMEVKIKERERRENEEKEVLKGLKMKAKL